MWELLQQLLLRKLLVLQDLLCKYTYSQVKGNLKTSGRKVKLNQVLTCKSILCLGTSAVDQQTKVRTLCDLTVYSCKPMPSYEALDHT